MNEKKLSDYLDFYELDQIEDDYEFMKTEAELLLAYCQEKEFVLSEQEEKFIERCGLDEFYQDALENFYH